MRIAVDSIIDIAIVLPMLKCFLEEHKNIEIDIREEVLNGAWEVLIDDSVDLLIGASGPVPQQKGIMPFGVLKMVFCVASDHALAKATGSISEALLSQYRTIVVHDSAKSIVPKTTLGVIEQSEHVYVANVDQKIKAIVAGIGGGFLPIKRVQPLLLSGELVAVDLIEPLPANELFIAWKMVNRGKGLQQLRSLITTANLADKI